MKLLDFLKLQFDIKNDRQLALALGVQAPAISKIRNGHSSITADFILKVHETFEMPIKDIKALI
jgi:plasmid maintenance system antidote protein VapI